MISREIVRAGAGAGKTTQLTKTVLDFARSFRAEHKRAPRIVVTTFTKKATEELRERLIQSACTEGDRDLISFVTSKSQLHISTIHGVLSLFLRRYGLWLGIDSNFQVAEDGVSKNLKKKVLREILIERPDVFELLEHFPVEELVHMLQIFSEAQGGGKVIQSITAEDLILAGKEVQTKLLSEWQTTLLAAKIQTEDQKWLTFIDTALGLNRQLKDKQLSFSKWLESSSRLTKPRASSRAPAFDPHLQDRLAEVFGEIKDCDEDLHSEENAKMYQRLTEKFLLFATEYNTQLMKQKLQSGRLEMSDLEALTLKSINEKPAMAQAFSADWDFWLVDEFQDTSPGQIEILDQLISDRPCYFVGDPQQSIYLFRGARSEVFQNKIESVVRSGGRLSLLDVNYRSRPKLLAFLNDFFAQLSPQFSTMKPHAIELEPEMNNSSAFFLPVQKDSNEPYLPLAHFIFEQLQKGARFDDFCVLARTNSELVRVSQYLQTLNLPTQIHSAEGFYSRREVQDALSLLKFLVNPHDNLNLLRVLRGPWFQIEDSELVALLASRPIFYWRYMNEKWSEKPVIQKLIAAQVMVRSHGFYETLCELIKTSGLLEYSQVYDSTGRREANIWKLLDQIKTREAQPGFQIHGFLQKLFDIHKSGNQDDSDAASALEPNRIHMMTIHQSKGLKFRFVLLPNLHKKPRLANTRAHEYPLLVDEQTDRATLALKLGEDGKRKHNLLAKNVFQKLSEKEREEFLRLIYVALTRAQEAVVLHWEDAGGFPFSGMNFDFTAGEHSGLGYQYQVQTEFSPLQPWAKDRQAESQVRHPWRTTKTTADTRAKISVTQLLAQQGEDIVRSTKEISTAQKHLRVQAAVFGQKFHSVLERMKYGPPINDINNELQKYSGNPSDHLYRALLFTLQLQTPPILELIRNGEVEWGFQYKLAKGLLEGQIDLWGWAGKNEYWIIDYKTGSSRHTEKAFQQLNLYSLPVRDLIGDQNIQLAAIFALEGKVEVRPAWSPNRIRAELLKE